MTNVQYNVVCFCKSTSEPNNLLSKSPIFLYSFFSYVLYLDAVLYFKYVLKLFTIYLNAKDKLIGNSKLFTINLNILRHGFKQLILE